MLLGDSNNNLLYVVSFSFSTNKILDNDVHHYTSSQRSGRQAVTLTSLAPSPSNETSVQSATRERTESDLDRNRKPHSMDFYRSVPSGTDKLTRRIVRAVGRPIPNPDHLPLNGLTPKKLNTGMFGAVGIFWFRIVTKMP